MHPQHERIMCDFKIKKVKETKIKFASRIKIYKLHEESVRSDFSSNVKDFKKSTEANKSV